MAFLVRNLIKKLFQGGCAGNCNQGRLPCDCKGKTK